MFGRIVRSAITGHADNEGSDRLRSHAQPALKLQERMLAEARPRELRPSSNSVWFIQMDACFEFKLMALLTTP